MEHTERLVRLGQKLTLRLPSGRRVEVVVLRVLSPGKVRLGVLADRDVPVRRAETEPLDSP